MAVLEITDGEPMEGIMEALAIGPVIEDVTGEPVTSLTSVVSAVLTTPIEAMDDARFTQWVRFHVQDRQVAGSFVTEYRAITRKCITMKGIVQDIIGKLREFEDKSPWLSDVSTKQWVSMNVRVMEAMHRGEQPEWYGQTSFELDEFYPTVDPMKAFWADRKKLSALVEKMSIAVRYVYDEKQAKLSIRQRVLKACGN